MRLSQLVFLLIMLFSVNSWAAQELSKEDVEQVFRDANSGNPKAQLFLGSMYGFGDGKGVPIDKAEAVKWYIKAADQNYAKAQRYLADAYRDGEGVTQDNAEARKWYQKAAALGDEQAKTALSAISVEPQQNASTDSEVKVQPSVIDSEFGIFKILMGLVLLCLVYVAFFNMMIKCKRLSLVVAPVMVFLLFFYYEPWVQKGCTGECNIRVDWVLIGPTIATILIIAVVNAGILWTESKQQNNVYQGIDKSLEGNQSVEFLDNYKPKTLPPLVIVIIFVLLFFLL